MIFPSSGASRGAAQVSSILQLLSDSPKTVLSFVGLLAAVIGVAFRACIGDDFVYDIWSDRDLWRGIDLANNFQVYGSEMGGTAVQRTPGGLQSYVYFVLDFFGAKPDTIWWLITVSFFAATWVLFKTLKETSNTTIALLSVGVLLTSYTAYERMLYLWNPAFAGVLMILAYCILIKLVIERRGELIVWLIFVSALAAQYHLSAFLMIAAALLLIVIFRISVTWKAWVLGGALFFITYAPFIYHELYNGYPWFSEAIRWRNDAKNLDRVGLSWVLQAQEFFSVVGNFYRIPFSSVFGGADRAGLPLLAYLVLMGISNLVSIAVGVHLLALAQKGWKRYRGAVEFDDVDRISIVNALVSIFFVLVFIFSAAELSRRRLVPLMPVAAVMGAIALYFMVEKIDNFDGGWLKKLVVSAGTLIVLFSLIFPMWHWVKLHTYWPRYSKLETLVYEFEEAIGSDIDYFRNKVALLSRYPHPRFIPSAEIAAGQFSVEVLLHQILIENTDDVKRLVSPTCIAVLPNKIRLNSGKSRIDGGVYPEKRPESETADVAKIAEDLLLAAAAGLGQDVNISKVSAREEYTFVEYRTQDGNCVKTFVNPYVLTEEERQVAAFRQQLVEASGQGDVKPFDPPTGAIGAFAFDLSNVFGPRSVLIHRDANGVYVSLHGRGSRGYQGFGSDYLKDPVVRFVSLSGGGAFDLLIGKAEIGEGVKLTPWRSKVLSLPEGSYKVILEAARLKSRTRKVENWSVVLSENLGVH